MENSTSFVVNDLSIDISSARRTWSPLSSRRQSAALHFHRSSRILGPDTKVGAWLSPWEISIMTDSGSLCHGVRTQRALSHLGIAGSRCNQESWLEVGFQHRHGVATMTGTGIGICSGTIVKDRSSSFAGAGKSFGYKGVSWAPDSLEGRQILCSNRGDGKFEMFRESRCGDPTNSTAWEWYGETTTMTVGPISL